MAEMRGTIRRRDRENGEGSKGKMSLRPVRSRGLKSEEPARTEAGQPLRARRVCELDAPGKAQKEMEEREEVLVEGGRDEEGENRRSNPLHKDMERIQ